MELQTGRFVELQSIQPKQPDLHLLSFFDASQYLRIRAFLCHFDSSKILQASGH